MKCSMEIREMKKLRIYRLVTECIPDRKSIPLVLFLFVMAAGYTLFFTSRLWFPDYGDLIEPTPLYERVIYQNYKIYLTGWEYADIDAAMQVILEFENKDLLEQNFQYQAVERTSGELEVIPVLETSDYVILQIRDIPKTWKEISLRVGSNQTEQVKFYTNIKAIRKVENLPARTETGYQIERLNAQLGYDDMQIKRKTQELMELEEENEELEQRIQELEETSYLSDEEARQAAEIRSRAISQIQVNSDDINDIEEDVLALEKRSENIEIQIQELENQE